jgi:PAS domain-containing protein
VADNIDPEFIARYGEHWCEEDVWIQGANAKGLLSAYSQAVGEALVDRRSLLATAFFNEFLKPLDVQGLAGTVIFDERDTAEAPCIYLSLYGALGQPEFEPAVLEQIRILIPHFRRALAIHWRLQRIHGESQLRQSMLDALPQAIFLLDGRGCIVTFNQKGRELLQAPGILAVHSRALGGLGRPFDAHLGGSPRASRCRSGNEHRVSGKSTGWRWRLVRPRDSIVTPLLRTSDSRLSGRQPAGF